MPCFQLTYDSKTFTDGSKNTRTYNSSLKCCIRCTMKFTVQKHFLKVLLAEASERVYFGTRYDITCILFGSSVTVLIPRHFPNGMFISYTS